MNVRCLSRISGVSGAVLLVWATFPASAHHSAATFNMAKRVSVSGTVEKWIWGNPHSWLFIRAVKADGSQDIWAFEGGSAGMLARSGWSADDMKRGDKITVTAAPARDGNHVGLMDQVKLASGRALSSGFGTPPGGAINASPPHH